MTALEAGIPGWAPATKTAGQVIAHVLRQFGDESGVQLIDSDLLAWINEAQNEIVTRNRVLKLRATANTAVGVQQISWPNDRAIQVESLHVNNVPLKASSMAQAEANGLTGLTDKGTPVQFWDWGGYLYLYPIPDAVYPLTLYYSAYPTDVTGRTSTLSVPDKYYQAVIAYVLQQAYELDEDWNASQAKNAQFAGAVTGLADEERAGSEMTYPTITLLPEWD